jgi:hypothetical protein
MTYEAPPALFEHCATVYKAMKDEAQIVEREGQDVLIYEGFLTKLFERLHLSTPYYSSVMAELQRMDCVRQLRRGGGSSPSEWAVVQKPTRQLWDSRSSRPRKQRQNRRAEPDEATNQRLRDLQKRIEALEEFTGVPRAS